MSFQKVHHTPSKDEEELSVYVGTLRICGRCGVLLDADAFSYKTSGGSACDICLSVSRYGLTRIDYIAQLHRQDGRCAICGTRDNGGKRFHVDHDHACCPKPKTCGQCNRGLLCFQCNHLLGNAKDDISILENAMNYLAGIDNMFEDE